MRASTGNPHAAQTALPKGLAKTILRGLLNTPKETKKSSTKGKSPVRKSPRKTEALTQNGKLKPTVKDMAREHSTHEHSANEHDKTVLIEDSDGSEHSVNEDSSPERSPSPERYEHNSQSES